MKCQGNITRGKRKIKCYKKCDFIYCKDHWHIFFNKLKDFFVKLNAVWKRVAFLLGGFLLLFGVYEACNKIIDFFAPCGKKDHISGKLLPTEEENTPTYYMDIGAFSVFPLNTVEEKDGARIEGIPHFPCPDKEEPMDLSLKIRNKRLVLSVTIRDIDGTILGRLKDNKWEIKPNNITDCDDSPTHLEVLDKRGDVVFRFENIEDTIHIRGYFIGNDCSMFLIDRPDIFRHEMVIGGGRSTPKFDSISHSYIIRNPVKYCKFYKNDN